MAHKIAVIPGDGIGIEVITEALKVARAAGVDLDTTEFDLGGWTRARSCPTPTSTPFAPTTPSCSGPSGLPRSRPGCSSAACCSGSVSSSTCM
jgi:hypothetical protein